jgi:hypothetical protein
VVIAATLVFGSATLFISEVSAPQHAWCYQNQPAGQENPTALCFETNGDCKKAQSEDVNAVSECIKRTSK